jgi:hypothetical protein
VQLELRALPWWTEAGGPEAFILGFPAPTRDPTSGRKLGAVRSDDVPLSDPVYRAIRCAWMIVPVGDPRPCEGDRAIAIEESHAAIAEVHAQLRARAGDAGASGVGDVRCFAEHAPAAGTARLWCEGTALSVAEDSRAPSVTPRGLQPAGYEQTLVGTRLVLFADGSAGMRGGAPYLGSSFGLRYRPLELGLAVLSFDPSQDQPRTRRIGLGATLLVRHPIARSRADALAGVTALAVAPNGATNPDFDGLYHGFVGVAYQTSWRLMGVAQPFAQLRLGAARGTGFPTAPMLELHLGLSTPERR